MDKANAEIIAVVAVMAFIFLVGLAAVAIFWRTYRREQKARQTDDPARAPRAGDNPPAGRDAS